MATTQSAKLSKKSNAKSIEGASTKTKQTELNVSASTSDKQKSSSRPQQDTTKHRETLDCITLAVDNLKSLIAGLPDEAFDANGSPLNLSAQKASMRGFVTDASDSLGGLVAANTETTYSNKVLAATHKIVQGDTKGKQPMRENAATNYDKSTAPASRIPRIILTQESDPKTSQPTSKSQIKTRIVKVAKVGNLPVASKATGSQPNNAAVTKRSTRPGVAAASINKVATSGKPVRTHPAQTQRGEEEPKGRYQLSKPSGSQVPPTRTQPELRRRKEVATKLDTTNTVQHPKKSVARKQTPVVKDNPASSKELRRSPRKRNLAAVIENNPDSAAAGLEPQPPQKKRKTDSQQSEAAKPKQRAPREAEDSDLEEGEIRDSPNKQRTGSEAPPPPPASTQSNQTDPSKSESELEEGEIRETRLQKKRDAKPHIQNPNPLKKAPSSTTTKPLRTPSTTTAAQVKVSYLSRRTTGLGVAKPITSAPRSRSRAPALPSSSPHNEDSDEEPVPEAWLKSTKPKPKTKAKPKPAPEMKAASEANALTAAKGKRKASALADDDDAGKARGGKRRNVSDSDQEKEKQPLAKKRRVQRGRDDGVYGRR